MLISIETHITCDFPGRSGPPFPLWIRSCDFTTFFLISKGNISCDPSQEDDSFDHQMFELIDKKIFTVLC